MNNLNKSPHFMWLSHMSFSDELPKVTKQPKSQKNVRPGTAVSFTIQATGMELSYQWLWKQAEKEGRSEKWQPCDTEWSDGGTLTIPKVQKSNEGSYRCIVTNCCGSQTSKAASLSVGKNSKFYYNVQYHAYG